MDSEWSSDPLLCGQQARHVGVDFPNLAVGAGNSHAVASHRTGSAAAEVIALIRGEDKQRVAGGDSIRGQAGEELVECIIIGSQCSLVSCLAGPECRAAGMGVVRIGNVSVSNLHTMLLH